MPAHSDEFPWPSYYGHFNFFENQMNAHSKVENLQKIQDGLYKIIRKDGRIIKTFICECYSFGVAEYEEVIQIIGSIDVVIINSNWFGYTQEVKLYCRKKEVGVFSIAGFMAALNIPQFWLFLDDYEKKQFKEQGFI